MASLLRQIVAGPRAKHQETGLDLCYVTDHIIATSGPSQTYPQRAYRNPLDQLVAFLDSKHPGNWAIWEFRAEGTGYPDEAVHGRIRHYPWPDHHPPPFHLVPLIMASMKSWMSGDDLEGTVDKESTIPKPSAARVVVVHCKAGKGRSGSMACSYLMSQCGWSKKDAIARFTERRMRPGFGAGVSIPSQLRWLDYVERWSKGGQKFVDHRVEILEVHVWGLRHGVKVVIEAFADEGKKIKVMHTFQRDERHVIQGDAPGGAGMMDFLGDALSPTVDAEKQRQFPKLGQIPVEESEGSSADKLPIRSKTINPADYNTGNPTSKEPEGHVSAVRKLKSSGRSSTFAADEGEPGGQAVIFRPKQPIMIANGDINLTLERRNRAPSTLGLSMVTAVAHVWFNTFFEGQGPENDGKVDESGVFQIDWEEMDGIKGSSRKGTKAADRISVLWRHTGHNATADIQPGALTDDGPIPQMRAADWKGGNQEDPGREAEATLGLRPEDPASTSVSETSSIKSDGDQHEGRPMRTTASEEGEDDDSLRGVKSSGLGHEHISAPNKE